MHTCMYQIGYVQDEFMRIRTYVYIHARTHARARTHTHTCKYVLTYARINVDLYVCTCFIFTQTVMKKSTDVKNRHNDYTDQRAFEINLQTVRSLLLLCQCISEETLKAVGLFYLVSMPGEVKDPTSLHWKCVTCRGLHHPLLETTRHHGPHWN